LQIEKVAKYQAKYTEFTQNLKQKKLIDSVKTADEISSGRTTYDGKLGLWFIPSSQSILFLPFSMVSTVSGS
jgi:hypothetical protein